MVYPVIKLEAMYDKKWKVSDHPNYHIKCPELSQFVDKDTQNKAQMTIKKWHFKLVKSEKDNRLYVSLQPFEAINGRLKESKFFTGSNYDLHDDKQIRNAIKFASKQISTQKQTQKLELGVQKKIHKSSDTESAKFPPATRIRKNTSEIETNYSSQVPKQREISAFTGIRKYQNSGYLCDDLTFTEAFSALKFNPLKNKVELFETMTFRLFQDENLEFHRPNREKIMDEVQRENLNMALKEEYAKQGPKHYISIRDDIDEELRRFPIEIQDILFGVKNGYISWEEIVFPGEVFTCLKDEEIYMKNC
jgi:hypothetical protein